MFFWPKTINSTFHTRATLTFQPFSAKAVAAESFSATYGYISGIVAPGASRELQQMLDAYRGWSWP